MNLKGLAGGHYKPLSEKDIQTIHEASLGILEKTGFTYESGLDDTLRMLEAAGWSISARPRAGSSFTAAPARTTWT
jgi:trimethylamine--corrinoid protein Co-methyltransferase